MLTTPYVFNPSEAERMADAGADLIVAHMGVTTGGSIGAKSSKTLDDCVTRIQDIADAARGVNPDVLVICHGGPDLGAAGRRVHHHALPRRRRLLRRKLGRAASGRARHRRSDQDVQEHPPAFDASDEGSVAHDRGNCEKALRFVTRETARIERAPWGKHWWLSEAEADRHEAADARARDDAAGHGPPLPLPSRRAKRSSTSSTASPSSGWTGRSAAEGRRVRLHPEEGRRTRSSTRRRSR